MGQSKARKTIYTIGHSTRPLDEFLSLLRENGIERLVDIRAYPASRTYPHYNKDNLEQEMPAAGIGYIHMRSLGGRRRKLKTDGVSPNRFWDNQSFRNYADYALSEEFRAALTDLEEQADKWICAIMCSEAVWWRCHRRIVADYLLTDGYDVLHIMNEGRTAPAHLTDGARPVKNGQIIYDLS